MRYLSILFMLMFFSSCATNKHRWMSGTVALKIDESRGVACIEPGSVKVGNQLRFMNNDCARPTFPDQRGSCQLVEAGELEITKILNQHYVEFKKISGPSFKEGSILGSLK